MGEGDLRQALTIATSLRVLIHETGASKPLLKRFKSNYLDLPVMDRIRPRKFIVNFRAGCTRTLSLYRFLLSFPFPKETFH